MVSVLRIHLIACLWRKQPISLRQFAVKRINSDALSERFTDDLRSRTDTRVCRIEQLWTGSRVTTTVSGVNQATVPRWRSGWLSMSNMPPRWPAAPARRPCKKSPFDAAAITHLITVTCTGFYAPGVDVSLVQDLPLRPTTERVQVGFMGCHGVVNGLRVAQGLAADPTNRILLCAVELCSLHYWFQWDPEQLSCASQPCQQSLDLSSLHAGLPGMESQAT